MNFRINKKVIAKEVLIFFSAIVLILITIGVVYLEYHLKNVEITDKILSLKNLSEGQLDSLIIKENLFEKKYLNKDSLRNVNEKIKSIANLFAEKVKTEFKGTESKETESKETKPRRLDKFRGMFTDREVEVKTESRGTEPKEIKSGILDELDEFKGMFKRYTPSESASNIDVEEIEQAIQKAISKMAEDELSKTKSLKRSRSPLRAEDIDWGDDWEDDPKVKYEPTDIIELAHLIYERRKYVVDVEEKISLLTEHYNQSEPNFPEYKYFMIFASSLIFIIVYPLRIIFLLIRWAIKTLKYQ